MPTFRILSALSVIAICFAVPTLSLAQLQSGVIEINVKNIKVDGKPARLSRKRFYMFAGGLGENARLMQRIKAAEVTSRNCYYKGLKVSPQFMCWLQAENCETPFCRVVESRFIDAKANDHVPEFLTAYNKGMTQFGGRANIARQWLLTNLSDDLVNGYYRQQQKTVAAILGDVKPVQSAMTDTAAVRTIFIDIPFVQGAPKKKFTFSNVLPIEIGGKSYVWTCERDVEAGKRIILDMSKTGKNCDVTVRPLNVCDTALCEAK